jgi:ATP-dependent protease HslVU (ClpYQ) peptidase subunit
MTILVAVKKNGRVFLGADRITTFGQEYFTDLVNGGKIIKLKHAYLATSGYTLMDNVLEHMHANNHAIMENKFSCRADVFQFMLELYTELKKQYTLTDTGKDTYAGIYNVFLVVTDRAIYGISNNLTVTEYPSYVAKGAGADYALGCFYALYDTVTDGRELARMALEAACHFCIYCKEPLDIIEVKPGDDGQTGRVFKDHGQSLHTVSRKKGAGSIIRQTAEASRKGARKKSAGKTALRAGKTAGAASKATGKSRSKSSTSTGKGKNKSSTASGSRKRKAGS